MMRRKMIDFRDKLEDILSVRTTKNNKAIHQEITDLLHHAQVKLIQDSERVFLLKHFDETEKENQVLLPPSNIYPSKTERRKASSGGSTLDDVCEEVQRHQSKPYSDSTFSLFTENQGLLLTENKIEAAFSDELPGLDFPVYLRQIVKQEPPGRRSQFEELLDEDWGCSRRRPMLPSKDNSLNTSNEKSFGLGFTSYDSFHLHDF